jgi:ABC-type uncharacterized transport system ATPase subunit
MSEQLSITASQLTKRFGDFYAVDHISFDVFIQLMKENNSQ